MTYRGNISLNIGDAQRLISNLAVYSVEAYGADNTGASDSRAAIQTAIDAANTAGGGTVYLPTGTYIVNDSGENHPVRGANYGYCLRMQSNVILELGSGTTLKMADSQITGSDAGVSGPVDLIVAVDETDWGVVGGGPTSVLDGNTANQSGWSGGYTQATGSVGIRSYGTTAAAANNIFVTGLTIQNFFSNAIDFRNDSGVAHQGHADVLVQNVWCVDVGEGPEFVSSDRVTVRGLHIDSQHTTIAAADNTTTPWVGDALEFSNCNDCRVEGYSCDGVVSGSIIDCFSSHGVVMSGFTGTTINGFFGGGTDTNSDRSTDRIELSNIVIENCIAALVFNISTSATKASDVRGTVSISNVSVDRCIGGFIVEGSHDTVSAIAGHPGYGDVRITNAHFRRCEEQSQIRDMGDRRLFLSDVTVHTTGDTEASFTVTTGTDKVNITSHGFSDNSTIMFRSTEDDGLPDPIEPETVYYVQNGGANDFEIATERDGASIDITTSGSGTLTALTGFPNAAIDISQTALQTNTTTFHMANCLFDNAGGNFGMNINDGSFGTFKIGGTVFGCTLINDTNAQANPFSCSASVDLSRVTMRENQPSVRVTTTGFNFADNGWFSELRSNGLSQTQLRGISQGSKDQILTVGIEPLDITDERDYAWAASGSGTSEYYLTTAAGGDPAIHGSVSPTSVLEDGTAMTSGTAGTLTAGQWDWADNDTLGYSTIYVRLTDSADPDSKARGFVRSNYQVQIYDIANGSGINVYLRTKEFDGTTAVANSWQMHWPDTIQLRYEEAIDGYVEVSRSENSR